MHIEIIKFKSPLSTSEIHEKYEARTEKFRQVPGLLQKYYMDWDSGEGGAVYVWESKEKMDDYLAGSVASGVAEAYSAEGTLTMQTGAVVLALHE